MRIVFLDQLGVYASCVAAAYYLRQVGKEPTIAEILSLPHFADHQDLHTGKLYYAGKNSSRDNVYTLGVGGAGKLIRVSAENLLNILGLKQDEIRLIDVSDCNTWGVKISWVFRVLAPQISCAAYISAFFLKKAMPRIAKWAEIMDNEVEI